MCPLPEKVIKTQPYVLFDGVYMTQKVSLHPRRTILRLEQVLFPDPLSSRGIRPLQACKTGFGFWPMGVDLVHVGTLSLQILHVALTACIPIRDS
jgi:hypothetical protein